MDKNVEQQNGNWAGMLQMLVFGIRGYAGFPELRIPFGGPHDKDYRILGLSWGPFILGNHHVTW